MEKLSVELQNCYGIPKLDYEFNFNNGLVYSIYSPNGTMKTSFAKVFKDIVDGADSSDVIFPHRSTVRNITSEAGDVDAEAIFVIEPYSQSFRSERISTLLVNNDLKKDYDEILAGIDEKKSLLLKELVKLSGLKKGCEEAFSEDFTHLPNEFFKALRHVGAEVEDCKEALYSDLQYSKIFSDKVIAFLETKDFKEGVVNYIEKYDDLVGRSQYFKKGVFNHNNAATIAKALKDNGFFKAQHSLVMRTEEKVSDEAELEKIIENEKEQILNDPDLVKTFDEIDVKLKANAELRNFREYLLDNLKILPELSNLAVFKQNVWISYLKSNEDKFNELYEEYSSGRTQIESIINQANIESTDWIDVINEFNSRFVVPFRVSAQNQDDVILKRETLNVKFEFTDRTETSEIDENKLFDRLSNGEKRALYILNIIFEVRARQKAGQKTLFLIDDIADSFDYKNKYAIIEYLCDISKVDIFRQIILTHNYDFFRTVSKRLYLERQNRLTTIKTDSKLILESEKYQNSPFQYWKDQNFREPSMLIASIAFVRNIAEYTGDQDCFLSLTSLLHIKSNTASMKIADLKAEFQKVLIDKSDLELPDENKVVLDVIFETAGAIAADNSESIDLEKKISLAVAVRLQGEQLMIEKVNDEEFVSNIVSNQTFALYEKAIDLGVLSVSAQRSTP